MQSSDSTPQGQIFATRLEAERFLATQREQRILEHTREQREAVVGWKIDWVPCGHDMIESVVPVYTLEYEAKPRVKMRSCLVKAIGIIAIAVLLVVVAWHE